MWGWDFDESMLEYADYGTDVLAEVWRVCHAAYSDDE